jgi:hypothetical protein
VDEFAQTQAQLNGPGIRGWWANLHDLTDEQRQSLDAAGHNRAITHRTISIVLERWGISASPMQVGHWRRNILKADR